MIFFKIGFNIAFLMMASSLNDKRAISITMDSSIVTYFSAIQFLL